MAVSDAKKNGHPEPPTEEQIDNMIFPPIPDEPVMSTDEKMCADAVKRSLPIVEIGAKLGLAGQDLVPYGHDKAKISKSFGELRKAGINKNGKLILVTGVNPTKFGEGKTTTSIGLCDGLNEVFRQENKTDKIAVCALREPSLGPVFGMKGGATGGGKAQVTPSADINLHFTGDLHAITCAHNLCAAMIDNHIYYRKEPQIDPRWKKFFSVS